MDTTLFYLGLLFGIKSTLSLHQVSYKKFSPLFDGSTWPKFIYKSLGIRPSEIHCAASCRIESSKGCQLYVYRNQECFLGQLGGSFSVLPPQGDSLHVHTTKEFAENAENFFIIPNATRSVWTQHIFETAEGYQSAEACMGHCVSNYYRNCDIAVFEGSNCHIGISELRNGSVTPTNSVGPWQLYLKPGFIDHCDLNDKAYEKGPLLNIPSQIWSDLIYKTVDNVMSRHECNGMCTFDKFPCQFHAFDDLSGTCFFGHYNLSTPAIAPVNLNLTLYTSINKSPSWLDFLSYYITQNDQYYELKAYRSIEGLIDDTEHCGSYCTLDPMCDFFVQSAVDCYLCNFNVNTSVISNRMHQYRNQYLNKARASQYNFFDPTYDLFINLTMKLEFINPYLEDCQMIEDPMVCVAWALLEESDEFIVMSDGQCCSGELKEKVNMHQLSGNSTTTVHFRKAYFQRNAVRLDLLYDKKAEDSSVWGSSVYDIYHVENTDPVGGLEECRLKCTLDLYGCYGFLLSGSQCYLTAHHVNSNLSIPSSLILDWYTTESNLGIRLGGHDGTGFVNGTSEVIKHDQSVCSQNGIPKLNALDSFGSPMIYFDPFLIVSGGINDSDTVNGNTHVVNLDSWDIVGWSQLGDMVEPRAFHELVQWNSSGIAALGGRNASNFCLDTVEFLDVASGNWSTMVGLTLPTPREKFCATAFENKIFIVGGYDCTNNIVLRDSYVIDMTTLSVGPIGDLPLYDRHSFACGIRPWPQESPTTNILRTYGGDKTVGKMTLSDDVFELDLNGLTSGWTQMNDTLTSFSMVGSSSKVLTFKRSATRLDNYILTGYSSANQYKTYVILEFGNTFLNGLSKFETSLPARAYAAQAVIPGIKMMSCSVGWEDWSLVMRQTRNGKFLDSQWSVNPDDPTQDIFSIMDTIENFRSTCDGLIHFRLYWPELLHFNEWKQGSNPTNETMVSNYTVISVSYTHSFGGLKLSDDVYGLMTSNDMNVNNYPHYTLGLKELPANGIPGPRKIDGSGVFVNEQLLFARKPC